MLRSHAALWESTGSFEMLVFHTLLAGNIGQFGAPGTVVVMGSIATAILQYSVLTWRHDRLPSW